MRKLNQFFFVELPHHAEKGNHLLWISDPFDSFWVSESRPTVSTISQMQILAQHSQGHCCAHTSRRDSGGKYLLRTNACYPSQTSSLQKDTVAVTVRSTHIRCAEGLEPAWEQLPTHEHSKGHMKKPGPKIHSTDMVVPRVPSLVSPHSTTGWLSKNDTTRKQKIKLGMI